MKAKKLKLNPDKMEALLIKRAFDLVVNIGLFWMELDLKELDFLDFHHA